MAIRKFNYLWWKAFGNYTSALDWLYNSNVQHHRLDVPPACYPELPPRHLYQIRLATQMNLSMNPRLLQENAHLWLTQAHPGLGLKPLENLPQFPSRTSPLKDITWTIFSLAMSATLVIIAMETTQIRVMWLPVWTSFDFQINLLRRMWILPR